MRFSGAFLAIAFAFYASFSVAQDIVLSAKAGDQKVHGTLIEYDGEFYRVETEFGPVTVDARTVICKGSTCPEVVETTEAFNVMGDPSFTIPLIEAFAVFQGAEPRISGAETKVVTIVSVANGVLAEVSVSEGSADGIRDGSDTLWFSALPPRDPSRATVIGLDAVVIAASDVNPLDAISLEQMRAVLSGEITNWKDLGSADAPIVLHEAVGDAAFKNTIKGAQLERNADVVVAKHPRLKDVADAVANDPFGLAVLPFSQLRNARAMGLRGSCGMQNTAQVFSLQSGSYPLRYEVSVGIPNKRLPIFAREFLEFLESEQAQAVIADLGFADMGIGARGLDEQGQRLANSMMIIGREVPLSDVREMTAIMSGAKRLSATFRFEAGSTRLDATSREHIDALAAGLILGNYADKVVHLMGFSDGDGRARQNKALSKERAEAVLAALLKAAPEGALEDVLFEVSGYGEASPLVCEDTTQDAQINRRVEVWVKDRVAPVEVAE